MQLIDDELTQLNALRACSLAEGLRHLFVLVGGLVMAPVDPPFSCYEHGNPIFLLPLCQKL